MEQQNINKKRETTMSVLTIINAVCAGSVCHGLLGMASGSNSTPSSPSVEIKTQKPHDPLPTASQENKLHKQENQGCGSDLKSEWLEEEQATQQLQVLGREAFISYFSRCPHIASPSSSFSPLILQQTLMDFPYTFLYLSTTNDFKGNPNQR